MVLTVLLSTAALAASNDGSPGKPAQRITDRAAFSRQLRADTKAHHGKGGLAPLLTAAANNRVRSFPHFTSSFAVGGQTYPYTMVGRPPASGESTTIRTVIVPLRMNFVFFGPDQDRVFEPTRAVENIVRSPVYNDAPFPNGVGQYGDQLQRAAFWNQMDRGHHWHVKLAPPRVLAPVTIEVTPETGTLQQISADPNDLIGLALFDFVDAEIRTILQFIELEPDEVPIFVTDSVYNEALGYHDAFAETHRSGPPTLRTFVYTSWFDVSQLGDLLADISTFNHELAEWLNDPYVNNVVPTWRYPPESDPRAVCSFNPLLEVGDPQGNGPTFDDFPTVVMPLNGNTYHLQQVVMLPWFADETPSSAYHGWYTFPEPSSLASPAAYCTP
jgi:hypothetical protein